MASLRRRRRSPYFIACFAGTEGKRHQNSTGIKADGTVVARRKAQKIADEFEDLAQRKRSAAQVQKVIQMLYQEIAGEALPKSTLRLFAKTWLDRKEPEVSGSTITAYRNKLNSFVDFMEGRADRSLAEISKDDIVHWRDHLANQVSASTANHSLKIIRVFLGAARGEGLLSDNPAEHVSRIKVKKNSLRRPFTVEEIRKLLEVANPEWKSMILFGLYTGQRLGDIASLTWNQIDLVNREIRLTTGKTSRNQKIPIPQTLLTHIASLSLPGARTNPVHSTAHFIYTEQGRVGTLSRQFHDLMGKAGLIPKKKHRQSKENPGRQGRRLESEISFHSLRHTTTSLLKNAGVSSAVAEEFVGHESAEMNRVYTHIELDAMRKAADSLPDVLS